MYFDHIYPTLTPASFSGTMQYVSSQLMFPFRMMPSTPPTPSPVN